MHFVNIRELRHDTNRVLGITARDGSVVITRRGKPVALLSKIKENDFIFRSHLKKQGKNSDKR